LAQALKVITDLGAAYTNFYQHAHSADFEKSYNQIYPSPEEFKVRISTEETGLPIQRSLTLGIGKSPGEVVSIEEDKDQLGYRCGKSVFLGVDMEQRLRLMAKEYDTIFLEAPSENRTTKINKFIDDTKKELGSPLADEFKQYQGDASPRMDFAGWAKKIEPSAMKLAHSEELPLVASVSGSMARILIALEDLHAFDTNGEFDFDKAKKVTINIIAFFNIAGHHSFFEVAEIYNRLIDYILLNSKRTPVEIKQLKEKCLEEKEWLEKKMDYYKAGDYQAFLESETRSSFQFNKMGSAS
jgi:hypothetical protein